MTDQTPEKKFVVGDTVYMTRMAHHGHEVTTVQKVGRKYVWVGDLSWNPTTWRKFDLETGAYVFGAYSSGRVYTQDEWEDRRLRTELSWYLRAHGVTVTDQVSTTLMQEIMGLLPRKEEGAES